MKKILFVSYGGGHVNSLLPVAMEMKKMGYEVVFFALTTAVHNLGKTDIEYLTYTDFFDTEDVAKVGLSLLGSIDDSRLSVHDTSIYLGKNYLELISEHGSFLAKKLYNKSGRYAFNPIKSMTEVLLKLEPSVVVSTSSPRSEKAVIYAANKLHIKSVVLSDLFIERSLAWFCDPHFASKVCVPSDFARKLLIDNGRSPDDVVVTGNPAFDRLVSLSKAIKNPKCYTYRVLWASQPEPEYFFDTDTYGDPSLPVKIESELIRIFGIRKDWKLVVRNHPNEDPREYPEFIEKSSSNEELSDVLGCIDVVITCTSIVGFEALILGKGFLTVDNSVLTPVLPFSKYGYSIGVDSVESIEESLVAFYSRKKEVQTGYEINNASERVCNVILDLIDS